MTFLFALLAALAFASGGVLMKHADGLRAAGPTAGYIALFAVGAVLQSLAMRGHDLGALYVLILGLEAALAFGFGVLLFGEPVTALRVTALALTVAGIALLRTTA
jgi:quaternary ammonium compound-resistance protein SugE